jgi:PTH2 family peptidyl-tRNA hydrolase
MLKQVILVRTDLKLPKGKMAAQVAHASVDAVLKSKASLIRNWRSEGMKKIVLKVDDLTELYKFEKVAKELDFVTALITDAGLTTVPAGTTTCLAIGPDAELKLDKLTGNLKIL